MKDYIAEVKAGIFPAAEHKYKFTGNKDEFADFLAEYEKTLDMGSAESFCRSTSWR